MRLKYKQLDRNKIIKISLCYSLQDRMTANGNSPLDNMRTLEHYLSDIMRAGATDTPEHLKGTCNIFLSRIKVERCGAPAVSAQYEYRKGKFPLNYLTRCITLYIYPLPIKTYTSLLLEKKKFPRFQFLGSLKVLCFFRGSC